LQRSDVFAALHNQPRAYSEAQQSEDGSFWRCKRYDGSRRCFFVPGMGS
jgi:hypothetical protein